MPQNNNSSPFFLAPLAEGTNTDFMGPYALSPRIGNTPMPSMWTKIVNMAERMPIANTISPYGISRGASVASVGGLEGYSQMSQGVQEIAAARELRPQRPELPVMEGLAHTLSGAMTAATPLMIGGGIESPVGTARIIGGAYAGSWLTDQLPRGWMSPETHELLNVVGSVLGGAAAGGPSMMRDLRSRVQDSVERDLRASRAYGTRVDEDLIQRTIGQHLDTLDAKANTATNLIRKAGQNIAATAAEGAGGLTGKRTLQDDIEEARTLNAFIGSGRLQTAYETSRRGEDYRTAARQAGAAPTGLERETPKPPQVPTRPEVGREASPAQTALPPTQPLSSSEAPSGPRESISSSQRPEVARTEPRFTGEEVVGSKDAALRDTNFFQQAKTEPGPEASISKIAQRAQELKEGASPRIERGEPRAPKFDDPERGSFSLRPMTAAQRASVTSPFRKLADVIDRVLPDKPETQVAAESILRDRVAQLARKTLQTEEKFRQVVDAHDSDGEAEFRAFMNAGEGKPGAQFANPTDQAVAAELHGMFQDRWDRVKQLKNVTTEIDDYMSHLWQKRGQARDLLGNFFAKSPLEGQAKFLKHRVYEYASDGLDSGLKPITYNPIRMQLTAMFQLDKFLMAHDIKNDYEGQGLIQKIKHKDSANKPSHWQTFDDKIFNPQHYDPKTGELSSRSRYYGPPEVAKVINRYLAPGLRGDPVYDKVRGFGNVLNQAQLGLSAYHFTFTSIGASVSDMALGIEKIWNTKDYRSGTLDILRSVVPGQSARMAYSLGKRIQTEALEPTGDPRLALYVRAIEKAGGRFKQEQAYTNTQVEGFVRSLKSGNFLRAASTGIQNIPVLKHIMQTYVPRIKLGVAARLIDAKFDYLQSQGISDPMTIAHEMGKVWDSVDNRHGQLVYDNLSWNKMWKDIAFIGVRAVGWNYGTLREFGGATRDVVKGGAELLRGNKPEMTSRMAFALALPVVTAILGGTAHYLTTGQAPKKLEDYFFPSDGKGGRLSFPTYWKDIEAYKHHPIDTIMHKLHPLIGMVAEGIQNRDFYGTEITNPIDSPGQKAAEIAEFIGKSTIPIGARGMAHQLDRGVSLDKAALSMFGIMPAPTYIGQTKAEELTFELAKRKWQTGPRTAGDQVQRETFMKFQQRLDNKTLTSKDIADAVKAGKFPLHDINRLFADRELSQFQREFKGLDLKEGLAVMKEADPNERAQLKSLLIKKVNEIGTGRYSQAQDEVLLKELKAAVQ